MIGHSRPGLDLISLMFMSRQVKPARLSNPRHPVVWSVWSQVTSCTAASPDGFRYLWYRLRWGVSGGFCCTDLQVPVDPVTSPEVGQYPECEEGQVSWLTPDVLLMSSVRSGSVRGQHYSKVPDISQQPLNTLLPACRDDTPHCRPYYLTKNIQVNLNNTQFPPWTAVTKQVSVVCSFKVM